jgi:phage repressor protein C with HTH and peptisase S24 domain
MELEEIIKTIKENGITAYKIAENTLLTEVGINKILNGSSLNPRKTTIQALEDYITNYVKSKDDLTLVREDIKQYTYSNDNLMYVPLVSEYAYGGYLHGFNDPEYIEELPKIPFIVEKEHKGEYMCFEVKGDSMDDGSHESYLERDILLCRNVRKDFWKSKLHINKWDFVIVHKDSGICLKRIVKHDVDKGIITLHSLNDYYEDFNMDLRDVSKIFNVVDVQRKRNRR